MTTLPDFHKTAERGVPLAPYTTWRIGGPAELLVQPASIEELVGVQHYARRTGTPLTILGRGSNVLIGDAGIPGITVCLRQTLSAVRFDAERQLLYAEAGCPLPKLAVTAGRCGLAGFEFLIGIPGTVGAGVAINAGLGGVGAASVRDILIEATLLDLETGTLRRYSAAELDLRYRASAVPELGAWVVEATFRALSVGDPQQIALRQQEMLKKRALKQPLQRNTSGSVFKQPSGGEAAGWYLDQLGLKGQRVGGAHVSLKHANWIENDGTATAADVRTLMTQLQKAVEAAFGIWLEPEVRFLPGAA